MVWIMLAEVLSLAVIGVAVAYWWSFAPLRRKRAMVQLDDGTTFNAVVMSRRGSLLVLADVTLHGLDTPQRVEGTVVIERSRVIFVQVV